MRAQLTRKHFVRLADYIKANRESFPLHAVAVLADFCHEMNPQFDRMLWGRYINGECGPCGGAIKPSNTR